jgi:hypothetical protein
LESHMGSEFLIFWWCDWWRNRHDWASLLDLEIVETPMNLLRNG